MRLPRIAAIKDLGALNFHYCKVAGTNPSPYFCIGFTALEGTVYSRTRDTEETNNG